MLGGLPGGHTWGVSLRLEELFVCCRAVISECKIESLQCCVSRRDVPLVRPKIQGDRSAFMPERERKYVGLKPPVDSWRTHLGCVPTFGDCLCVVVWWSRMQVVSCLKFIQTNQTYVVRFR